MMGILKNILILIIVLNFGLIHSQPEHIIYSPYSDSMINNTNVNTDSIFNFILSNEHLIDFNDCNICKSRAHILSRVIEKKFEGVNILKVWLIADCKRSSQKEYYRYKQNYYLRLPGKCSNWVYHVAPAALINGDTVVFDPATQNKSVSLKKWAEKLITPGSKAYLIIKENEYYYYPESSDNYFLDETADWNTDEQKMKDEKYLRSIDDILRAKQGYYEPWKFNYYMQELLKLID